jgi:hypothetical protein
MGCGVEQGITTLSIHSINHIAVGNNKRPSETIITNLIENMILLIEEALIIDLIIITEGEDTQTEEVIQVAHQEDIMIVVKEDMEAVARTIIEGVVVDGITEVVVVTGVAEETGITVEMVEVETGKTIKTHTTITRNHIRLIQVI